MSQLSSLNENAQKWVRALRSGLFKQGRGYLHSKDIKGNDYYCCLGVACELAILDGVKVSKTKRHTDQEYYEYDTHSGVLPESVMHWLGLRNSEGDMDIDISPGGYHTLTELNDNAEYKFDQIADLIESNPAGLFRQ